jgi:hypothetical protein
MYKKTAQAVDRTLNASPYKVATKAAIAVAQMAATGAF